MSISTRVAVERERSQRRVPAFGRGAIGRKLRLGGAHQRSPPPPSAPRPSTPAPRQDVAEEVPVRFGRRLPVAVTGSRPEAARRWPVASHRHHSRLRRR